MPRITRNVLELEGGCPALGRQRNASIAMRQCVKVLGMDSSFLEDGRILLLRRIEGNRCALLRRRGDDNILHAGNEALIRLLDILLSVGGTNHE